MPAVSGGLFGAGRRVRVRQSPSPQVRPVRPPTPQRGVSAGPRVQNSLTAPIGRVNPAGQSPSQRNARVLGQQRALRQQIIATRQIQVRQEPKPLANPRQDVAAVQHRQQQAAVADRRAQHMAAQQIRMVQDQVPNPQRAAAVIGGQYLQKLRVANDIGRLTKISTNTQAPLEHRAGALRTLRSRYGVPVTQQNFKAFRQAQAFHEFLTTGKEGETFTLPNVAHGGQRVSVGKKGFLGLGGTTYGRTPVTHGPQTYQLQKQGRELVPVAVHANKDFTVSGLLSGHPYAQHGYSPDLTPGQAISKENPTIASGFTHAAVDVADYGTRLIPAGKVGTPLRRAITEVSTLPIQAPTAAYGAASAAVNAARGKPQELKALAKNFSQEDPLGRLVTHGDFKAFGQHPGIAAVELLGGLGALDRAAGRVSRGGGVIGLHGGKGTFGRGVAPELRPYREAPLTRLAVQERYSHGYVAAARQGSKDAKAVAAYNDKRSAALSEAMKAEHAKAAGDVGTQTLHENRAIDLLRQAEQINPNRLRSERTMRTVGRTTDFGRLGDVQEGVSQARARQGRSAIIRELAGHGAVRRSNRDPGVLRKGSEGVVQALFAQGALAPNRADLLAYAKHLSEVAPHIAMDAEKVALNRSERGAVLEVAKAAASDPHLLPSIMDDARRYARINRSVHNEAHAADILPREEARMSALKVFAVRRMGAVADEQGILRKPAEGVSFQDVTSAESAAQKAEARARSLRGMGSQVSRERLANAELEAQAARTHLDSVAPRLQSGHIEDAMRKFAATPKGKGHITPEEVAFVSHSPSITQPGVFNIRGDTAKGLPTRRRTGEAIRYGTSNPGRDAMLGTVVRLRNMVSAVHSFRDAIQQGAARYRSGERQGHVITEATRADAEAAYRAQFTDQHGHLMPGYVPGRAVRLNPFGGRQEQLAATLQHADSEGFLPGGAGVHREIQQALEGGGGQGPWTVVPEPFAQRLAEHSKVTAGGSPLVRSITSAFRHTVLPFSPTWLAGNVLEAGLRTALAGAGKRSAEFEAKVTEELARQKPDVAQRVVLGLGYGHIGSAHNWHVRNTANSIGDSALGPIKEALQKLEQVDVRGGKPVEATANLIRAYTDWVMNSVNGSFENGVKRAMAGKHMTDFLAGTEHAGKLTEEAVKAVANELGSNPAAVDELIKFVQRKFGQYEHFSPEMRRWIVNWTPFGAWMWNATTFLVRNLPQDHPGVLALLAANDSATRQWRIDNGLDATTATLGKGSGQVPTFLQGSIPTPSWYARLMGVPAGTPLRLARYTPFGLYNDPLSNIASAFLPQFPLDALQGRTFTGKELKNSDGTPYDSTQKAAYAALQGALATIPIVGQLSRFISYGGNLQAANRVLNPFSPSNPKTSTSGASSSPGGLPAFSSAGSPGSGGSSSALPAFKP